MALLLLDPALAIRRQTFHTDESSAAGDLRRRREEGTGLFPRRSRRSDFVRMQRLEAGNLGRGRE